MQPQILWKNTRQGRGVLHAVQSDHMRLGLGRGAAMDKRHFGKHGRSGQSRELETAH